MGIAPPIPGILSETVWKRWYSWTVAGQIIKTWCFLLLFLTIVFYSWHLYKCFDAFPRSPCATLCQPLCALRASEDYPTWLNIYLLAHIYIPRRKALEILVSFKLCIMIGTASNMPILLEFYDLFSIKCILSRTIYIFIGPRSDHCIA